MRFRQLLLLVTLVSIASRLAAQELVLEEVDFKPVQGEATKADWGTLAVPENRQHPSDRLLRLTVARFRSTAAKPGSPIVYLEGGPGVSGLNSAFGFLFPLIAELRTVSDVIVLDQRGSGRSEPDTKCSARVVDFIGTELNERAMRAAAMAASARCAEALRAKNVDLGAIHTDENADDLETLRIALGAERLNLLSFSYGTHVAATFARRHRHRLDRLVLVGPALPDELLKLPGEQEAHVRAIAALARSDGAVPDLLGLMKSVHAQLDAQPALFEVTDPESKQTRTVTLSGYGMQWLVAAMLGKPEMITAIPLLYVSTARGDYALLREATGFLFAPVPRATNFLARCAAVASPAHLARLRREKEKAVLSDAVNFPEPEGCTAWPHGRSTLHERFRWSGPTLVVAGTLDGNAPPIRIDQLRRWFPKRQGIVVEFAGHNDLLVDETVRGEIVRFFREARIGRRRAERPRLPFLPIPVAKSSSLAARYPGG